MNTFRDYLEESEFDDLYMNLDMLDDEDFQEFIDSFMEEDDELSEALSIAARKKRSHLMKRLAKKMQKSKERKEMKTTSKEDLMKRARKAAIKGVQKKLTGGKTDLTLSDKKKIETKISKMGAKIDKLAKKKFKAVKKADKERKAQMKLNKKEQSNTKGMDV